MKKIFFALAIFMGFSNTTGAQESKYAQNYAICRSDTGYLVCPDQSVSNLNDPAPAKAPPYRRMPAWQQNSFVSPANTGETPGTQRMPGRKALESSYPGKDEQMEQNNKRNLNSGNNNYISPSTGEIR